MEDSELNNSTTPEEGSLDNGGALTQEEAQPAAPAPAQEMPQQTPAPEMYQNIAPSPTPVITQDVDEGTTQPTAPDQISLPSSDTASAKPKTPLLIIILAWLTLIVGALGAVITALFLFGGGIVLNSTFLSGALVLANYILMIVTSFGLRWMKRWALIVFSVGTGLSIISTILSKTDYPFAAVSIIVLVFLWIINKQFK